MGAGSGLRGGASFLRHEGRRAKSEERRAKSEERRAKSEERRILKRVEGRCYGNLEFEAGESEMGKEKTVVKFGYFFLGRGLVGGSNALILSAKRWVLLGGP
jgi:hypothetical protein